MTLNCDNIAVAELHINGVVYARRNHHWQQMIPCYNENHCGCSWDANHPAPSGWDNILFKHWVELPAGVNTITVRGFRFGRSGVQSAIEAAVWRKTCPPQVVSEITCIPPEVIAEQGLCYLEQQAALEGIMVGCIELTDPCTQGPDVYQNGPACIHQCIVDGCEIYPPDSPNGQLMNTITLNYPYAIRVDLEWETTFIQDFIGQCEGCPDHPC